MTWLPDADKWIATQQNGKLFAFPNDPVDASLEPLLDLNEVLGSAGDAVGTKVQNAYAIKFHPDLKRQPWCFITFTSRPKHDRGHHLGRLRVLDPSVPTVDPNSLEILASWKSPWTRRRLDAVRPRRHALRFCRRRSTAVPARRRRHRDKIEAIFARPCYVSTWMTRRKKAPIAFR